MSTRALGMIVTCDSCSQTYEPELIAVPTDAGGEYQSFTCPHCKTEYPVCTITKHGLEIREEIKRLRETVKARPEMFARLKTAMLKFDRECRAGVKPNATVHGN